MDVKRGKSEREMLRRAGLDCCFCCWRWLAAAPGSAAVASAPSSLPPLSVLFARPPRISVS